MAFLPHFSHNILGECHGGSKEDLMGSEGYGTCGAPGRGPPKVQDFHWAHGLYYPSEANAILLLVNLLGIFPG